MNILDITEETYTALSSNWARSGLTILGIVIGIGSVIAMVSIGQGAQTSIQSNIQAIGSNLLIVMPGAPRGQGFQVSGGRGNAKTLTLADVEAVANTLSASVKGVAPSVSSRAQVTAKGKNTNTDVNGVTASFALVRNFDMELGGYITDQAYRASAKVAVLGPTTRDDLFGVGADPTGQTIRIKNFEYKIIGVTKSKGGSGFGNQDDEIFIPLSTAQHYITGDSYVSTISVSAMDASAMASVQQEITDLLLLRHHISDPTQPDFNVLSQTDILATASSITGTLTILLSAIAGISLVVGGIGIMNMMLTTVTERTREIGLRKAIGATQNEIRVQFLSEAVALTFFGGVVGVLLGWAVSWGITASGLLQTTITLNSILLAFGVSASIGVVFGYYPAGRAAKLNPIDALRYE